MVGLCFFFKIKQINDFTSKQYQYFRDTPRLYDKAHNPSKGIFLNLFLATRLSGLRKCPQRSQPPRSSGIQICYANEFELYNLKLFCEREILRTDMCYTNSNHYHLNKVTNHSQPHPQGRASSNPSAATSPGLSLTRLSAATRLAAPPAPSRTRARSAEPGTRQTGSGADRAGLALGRRPRTTRAPPPAPPPAPLRCSAAVPARKQRAPRTPSRRLPLAARSPARTCFANRGAWAPPLRGTTALLRGPSAVPDAGWGWGRAHLASPQVGGRRARRRHGAQQRRRGLWPWGAPASPGRGAARGAGASRGRRGRARLRGHCGASARGRIPAAARGARAARGGARAAAAAAPAA